MQENYERKNAFWSIKNIDKIGSKFSFNLYDQYHRNVKKIELQLKGTEDAHNLIKTVHTKAKLQVKFWVLFLVMLKVSE